MKEGHFIVVDDAASRHHMITAAIRLGIEVVTRRCSKGYEVHRIAKAAPPAVFDYPVY